jgi:hypothetical protein
VGVLSRHHANPDTIT